jgi:6-phospho-3-hexuloisomerase
MKCKHPLRSLGLSESSYLKCNKCNIIIKKNEINSSIDHNYIKSMKNSEYNEKAHLISVGIKEILNNLKYNNEKLNLNVINRFIETILSSNTIFVLGSGQLKLTSCAFCMRLVHLNLNSFIVGDIASPQISEKDCLIIISDDENSYELANAKNAKVSGCKILLLTSNNSDSKIAKLSDITWNVEINNLRHVNEEFYNEIINNDYFKMLPQSTIFKILSIILLDGLIAEIIIKLTKYEIDLKNKHFNLEQ